MDAKTLDAQLEALSKRISDMRSELKAEERWNDGHRLTSGELDARYAFLKSQLNDELEDLEAHGKHVSGLEASVRAWIDSLSLETK